MSECVSDLLTKCWIELLFASNNETKEVEELSDMNPSCGGCRYDPSVKTDTKTRASSVSPLDR